MADTTYTPAMALAAASTHYWRVRILSQCHTGPWSGNFEFETKDQVCLAYESTAVPVVIPADATGTFLVPIVVNDNLIIEDISASIDITHSWVGDLDVELLRQSATMYGSTLVSSICTSADDMILTFNDDGSDTIPCPPNTADTVQPWSPLAFFNDEQSYGTWLLSVTDVFEEDGGTVNSFSLEICGYVPDCTSEVVSNLDNGSGTLRNSIQCAQAGDTVTVNNNLLFDQTVTLESPILIDKDVTILGTVSGGVLTVQAPSGQPAFVVETGNDVNLDRFSVVSHPDTNGGAIVNNGNLSLTNMIIGRDTNAVLNNGNLTIIDFTLIFNQD